ncbi:hypothetical protein [Chondromyces crocatus]|uniref:Uncharacterized protein n=1 Tax=Chondromyces crocatus TaxID=52 RepID=A0A0K1EKQ7_CHOCO|nr:hypothetical protein [Chondromyces crocatus]AKT41469.1 uncharacterized protein CMC5_056720 [Chondromyces crocatus]
MMTSPADAPPPWPPQITRRPPPPVAGFSSQMRLWSFWTLISVSWAVPAWNEESLVAKLTLGAITLIGLCGGLFGLARAWRERQAYPRLLAAHAEKDRRLVPAWARVDKSVFGAERVATSDGVDRLLGYEMALELTVWLPDTREADHRHALERLTLSCRHDVEPHVASALGTSTWLEIAYDPLERTILPQHLVTPNGAKIPVQPLR